MPEFLMLAGACVLIVAVVAWVGRRRQPDHRFADGFSSVEQRRLRRANRDDPNMSAGGGFG